MKTFVQGLGPIPVQAGTRSGAAEAGMRKGC